jgi:hypothetical protein
MASAGHRRTEPPVEYRHMGAYRRELDLSRHDSLTKAGPTGSQARQRWRGWSGPAASVAGRRANQRRQRQRAKWPASPSGCDEQRDSQRVPLVNEGGGRRPPHHFLEAVSELVSERRSTTPYLALGPSGRRRRPVTTWPTVLALCVDDGKPVSRCYVGARPSRIRPRLVTSNVVRTHGG